MKDKLEGLLDRIKELEKELLVEVEAKQWQFSYRVQDRKVQFTENARARHKLLTQKLMRYLYQAKPLSALSTPMILFCAVPIIFMDFVAAVFQFVCFPVYGIPKVPRKDYVVRTAENFPT